MASFLVAAWASYHVTRWFYEQGYMAGRDTGVKNFAWFYGIGRGSAIRPVLSIPGTSTAAGGRY